MTNYSVSDDQNTVIVDGIQFDFFNYNQLSKRYIDEPCKNCDLNKFKHCIYIDPPCTSEEREDEEQGVFLIQIK